MNGIIYYLSVNIRLLKDKKEAQIAVASLKNGSGIIKVPLVRYAENAESEIWVDGKLYDVVKRQLVNDTVYISVYHDSSEQGLLSEIKEHFTDNGTPSSNKDGFKKSHSIVENLFINNYQHNKIVHSLKSIHTIIHNESFILSYSSGIVSPPPEYI